MRFNLNVSFTRTEIEAMLRNVARSAVLDFIHDGVNHINALKIDPNMVHAIFKAAGEAVGRGVDAGRSIDAEFVGDGPCGPPPPWAASPPPWTPKPMRCRQVPDAGFLDEGWMCCSCPTYNAQGRTVCRRCGHVRCEPPSAPSEDTPPPEATT